MTTLKTFYKETLLNTRSSRSREGNVDARAPVRSELSKALGLPAKACILSRATKAGCCSPVALVRSTGIASRQVCMELRDEQTFTGHQCLNEVFPPSCPCCYYPVCLVGYEFCVRRRLFFSCSARSCHRPMARSCYRSACHFYFYLIKPHCYGLVRSKSLFKMS